MKQLIIFIFTFVVIGLYGQIPGSPDANGTITPGPPDWVTGAVPGDGELKLQFEYINGRVDSSKTIFNYGDSTINNVKSIQFDTLAGSLPWKAGRMMYDSTDKTVSYGTGVQDVTIQGGQEVQYPLVINNTGATLYNGTPVFTSSVNANGVIQIDSAKANSPFTSLSTLGLVTADIPDGETGFVTWFGKVREINSTGLIAGNPVYLGANGGKTATKPLSPDAIVILGACLVVDNDSGVIDVTIERFTRPLANKSYSFTSNGILAGTYYVGGFYEAPAADANLTQASLTQTLGTANNPYNAHAFIVAGGAGTVDAGQVGLRVIGNSFTDAGVNTAVDTTVLTTDITTLSTDDYLETSTKWLGTGTYELYTVSGSPTTYSLDFNYGYCKYEDFGNKDFSVNVFEAVGLAGATDASFDMELLHHSSTGWTYSAAAFTPGDGIIVQWSTDMAPNDNLANNENFAWKRSTLAQFINGDSDEGIIIRITAGANGSIQSVDIHVTGEIESF